MFLRKFLTRNLIRNNNTIGDFILIRCLNRSEKKIIRKKIIYYGYILAKWEYYQSTLLLIFYICIAVTMTFTILYYIFTILEYLLKPQYIYIVKNNIDISLHILSHVYYDSFSLIPKEIIYNFIYFIIVFVSMMIVPSLFSAILLQLKVISEARNDIMNLVSTYLYFIFAISFNILIDNPSFINFVSAFITSSIVIACFTLGSYIGILLVNFLDNLLDKRKSYLYSDALIVDSLLKMLLILENNPIRWTIIEVRNHLVTLIETIASCIEHDLPRRLHAKDVETQLWMTERNTQVAANIREWKKLVLIPKSDAREELINRIKIDLILAASGDWDGFEKDLGFVTKPSNKRMAFISSVMYFLRIAFTGVIPIIILWLIQEYNKILNGIPAISEPISNYIFIGCYIYAVLSIMSAFDPLYNDKITTIKSITDIIPFFDRGKKD